MDHVGGVAGEKTPWIPQWGRLELAGPWVGEKNPSAAALPEWADLPYTKKGDCSPIPVGWPRSSWTIWGEEWEWFPKLLQQGKATWVAGGNSLETTPGTKMWGPVGWGWPSSSWIAWGKEWGKIPKAPIAGETTLGGSERPP